MGRRIGSVDRTPEEMRKVIDGVLRTNRMTVDELRQHLAALYPEAEVPSRSALYRYKGSIEALTGRMRAMQQAAETIVADLGENPDDKAGGLLVQAITALTANAALEANAEDADVGIEDVRKLARAARDVISARSMSLKERQQVEQMARDKLLREQSERLDKVVKSGGLSEETAADLRRKILGIG
jgi:predicted transcriptional regulator